MTSENWVNINCYNKCMNILPIAESIVLPKLCSDVYFDKLMGFFKNVLIDIPDITTKSYLILFANF